MIAVLQGIAAYLIGNWQELAASFFIFMGGMTTALAALYAIALKIPGDQPDKAIAWLLAFTQKFSSKPAASEPPSPPPAA